MLSRQFAVIALLSSSYTGLAQDNAKLAKILQAIDLKKCGHLAIAWIDGNQSGNTILSNNDAVDINSLYEIGSITKGITGIALAQAVLNNRISLSDDVYSLLPFENKEKLEYLRSITLEDLATHTSGLPRIPSMSIRYAWQNRNNPYVSFDESKLETALAKTNLWKQGSGNYSNLGFGLLGFLVSNAQQKDYASFVEQTVLIHLGMENSKVHYSSFNGIGFAPALKENCKEGHRWISSNPSAAAGAIKSNLHDMNLLLEALLNPEQSALADAIQLATKPRKQFDNRNMIGLGWLTQVEESGTILWHNGGTGSFTSFIGINKDKERAVVLLFNKPMHNKVTKAGFDFLLAQ